MRYVIITNNGRLPHTSLLQHEFRVLIRQERRYNLLRMQNATSISIMIGPVNGGLACPVIRLIIGVRAIKIRGERNYFVRHRQKLPKFLCLKICNFLADMRRAVVNEDESWQVRVCVRVFNIPSQTRTSVVWELIGGVDWTLIKISKQFKVDHYVAKNASELTRVGG